MFVNTTGRFVNPESLSQLFDRLQRTMPDLTRIRFHDMRHTHASLLKLSTVALGASFGRVEYRATIWAAGFDVVA